MGDNVEVFHGAVWAVSLTEMEAAVPPHAALAAAFLFALYAKPSRVVQYSSRTRTTIFHREMICSTRQQQLHCFHLELQSLSSPTVSVNQKFTTLQNHFSKSFVSQKKMLPLDEKVKFCS
jgi:hypothetical protein